MCLSFSAFACLVIWMWSRQKFREPSKQQPRTREKKPIFFVQIHSPSTTCARICHIIWMCFALNGGRERRKMYSKLCMCSFDTERLHPTHWNCVQEQDMTKKNAIYSKPMHRWCWHVHVERIMHFMENRHNSFPLAPQLYLFLAPKPKHTYLDEENEIGECVCMCVWSTRARRRDELVKNAFWCCFHLSELIHKSKS